MKSRGLRRWLIFVPAFGLMAVTMALLPTTVKSNTVPQDSRRNPVSSDTSDRDQFNTQQLMKRMYGRAINLMKQPYEQPEGRKKYQHDYTSKRFFNLKVVSTYFSHMLDKVHPVMELNEELRPYRTGTGGRFSHALQRDWKEPHAPMVKTMFDRLSEQLDQLIASRDELNDPSLKQDVEKFQKELSQFQPDKHLLPQIDRVEAMFQTLAPILQRISQLTELRLEQTPLSEYTPDKTVPDLENFARVRKRYSQQHSDMDQNKLDHMTEHLELLTRFLNEYDRTFSTIDQESFQFYRQHFSPRHLGSFWGDDLCQALKSAMVLTGSYRDMPRTSPRLWLTRCEIRRFDFPDVESMEELSNKIYSFHELQQTLLSDTGTPAGNQLRKNFRKNVTELAKISLATIDRIFSETDGLRLDNQHEEIRRIENLSDRLKSEDFDGSLTIHQEKILINFHALLLQFYDSLVSDPSMNQTIGS